MNIDASCHNHADIGSHQGFQRIKLSANEVGITFIRTSFAKIHGTKRTLWPVCYLRQRNSQQSQTAGWKAKKRCRARINHQGKTFLTFLQKKKLLTSQQSGMALEREWITSGPPNVEAMELLYNRTLVKSDFSVRYGTKQVRTLKLHWYKQVLQGIPKSRYI